MFSFYTTHPQPLYHSALVYSVYSDDDLYSPYLSSYSRSPGTNPEVRYRRAIGEYLAAKEEYNALLHAREKAKLRARAEAVRQERARLAQLELARARREQQARLFKQGLAKALAGRQFPRMMTSHSTTSQSRSCTELLNDPFPTWSFPLVWMHTNHVQMGRVLRYVVFFCILFAFWTDHDTGAAQCRERHQCQLTPSLCLRAMRVLRAQFRICSPR